MKSDQDTRAAGWVSVELLEEEAQAFHGSLGEVLERIAPLTAMAKGLSGEERLRRLAAAINIVLDTLEDLTGMADAQRLPLLIERVGQLAVTGDNVQVHIGIAGDLRVDKHHRLAIETVLASLKRVPPSVRPTAVREGITTLERLLAFLLSDGWTDDMSDGEARQAARRAIVDTVQGRVSAAPTASVGG
jgi:hypothetical protein